MKPSHLLAPIHGAGLLALASSSVSTQALNASLQDEGGTIVLH